MRRSYHMGINAFLTIAVALKNENVFGDITGSKGFIGGGFRLTRERVFPALAPDLKPVSAKVASFRISYSTRTVKGESASTGIISQLIERKKSDQVHQH